MPPILIRCPNDSDNDIDGDGVCWDVDNCPTIANPDQADQDGDSIGNACDVCPADSYNVCNFPCSTVEMVWTSGRRDPNCDSGQVGSSSGYCYDPATDLCTGYRCLNGNEISPSCYSLSQCESVCAGECKKTSAYRDQCDECPGDPNKTDPGICGCGITDTDTDADGIVDCIDNCPNDPDNDIDGDGVCGDIDNCPANWNEDQANFDGDDQGDVCDSDDDNDGALDDADECPETMDEVVNDIGCSISELCPCEDSWKNHGAYVSCVAQTSNAFLADGLISESKKESIVSDAAESVCGKEKGKKK